MEIEDPAAVFEGTFDSVCMFLAKFLMESSFAEYGSCGTSNSNNQPTDFREILSFSFCCSADTLTVQYLLLLGIFYWCIP